MTPLMACVHIALQIVRYTSPDLIGRVVLDLALGSIADVMVGNYGGSFYLKFMM